MSKKKSKKPKRKDAHGVRAVVRKNRAARVKASPVVIPIAVHHDPVKGPVVVVAEDVPVMRVPRLAWLNVLFGNK